MTRDDFALKFVELRAILDRYEDSPGLPKVWTPGDPICSEEERSCVLDIAALAHELEGALDENTTPATRPLPGVPPTCEHGIPVLREGHCTGCSMGHDCDEPQQPSPYSSP